MNHVKKSLKLKKNIERLLNNLRESNCVMRGGGRNGDLNNNIISDSVSIL